MDDNAQNNLTNNQQFNQDSTIETTSKQSIITNEDGSPTYVSQITEKKTGTGIISEPNKVEEVSLGVSAEDTKYVDAIRAKKELGILNDDKLLTYISVNAFEKILKFMNESLETYFDALSFGIYSSQEITELKKSIKTRKIEKEENIIKYFEVYSEEDKNKLDKFKALNDDIFFSVDRQLEIIKEEEERKKREEEERLRRLKEAEEQQKKWKTLRRNNIKTLFEQNINSYEPFQIMKRRFQQYKDGIEEAKKKQKIKEMEEQKRLLRLKKQKEEEQKKQEEEKKKMEEERIKKEEEEERKKKVEEQRKKREEEERKKKEEEERIKKKEEEKLKKMEVEKLRREEEKRLKKEEEERLKKEEEDRLKKEEEERLKKLEEERRKKEEEDRLKKEEEERRKKEEEDRLKKEEEKRIKKLEEERLKKAEEERLRREEEERLKKLEEERRKKEEEDRLKKEEEERLKKLEEERLKKEEADRLKKEEEERIKKEEEDRLKKVEVERLKREEEERLKKEEENRLKMEEEEKLKKEEEERLKKEEKERLKKEEEERLKKLEEERLKKEEEDRIKKTEEERLKKLKEDRIKKEEEERLKKMEEERLKKEEEDRLEKEEEERLKKLDKIQINEDNNNNNKNENDENILLTLDNQITFHPRQDIKQKKDENSSTKKEEEKLEVNTSEEKKKNELEKEKEKISPTSELRPKNLLIGKDIEKIIQNNSNKLKPQTKQVKKLEKKKVSKKPLKNHSKKIILKENNFETKKKNLEHKPLLTEKEQAFSPSNRTIKIRKMKKDNLENLIYDSKQIQFKYRYYNELPTQINLDNNEPINIRERRNKSAERRPIKNNLDGEQYIKIICKECGEKNYFGNYCENCRGPICSKCKAPHLIENPFHRYNIFKNKNYISKKLEQEKCTKCEKNLENKIASKCLNCPKELFCDECKINHNLIYPEHNIISKIKEKNNDLNEESEESLDNNKNTQEIIKCIICQNKILFKDNNYITHCNKCKGNLCSKCENIHSKKKPLHKFISLNTMIINDTSNIENYYKCVNCSQDLNNNIYLYNCHQCNGNLCKNCGNEHFKEYQKHRIRILKSKLANLENNNFNCFICGIISTNRCEKCKILLCDKCKENHKQKYSHHKIIILQNKELNKNLEENKKNEMTNCVLCLKRIRLNEKNSLSFCENCDGTLCQNCIIRHKDYYPFHKIYNQNLRKKLKEKKKEINKEISIKICYQCKRKLNINIQYCFRCNEYYCDKCGKSHNYKFPKHKLRCEKQKPNNEMKNKFEDDNNNEKEEILSIFSKEESENYFSNNEENNKNSTNSNQDSLSIEKNEKDVESSINNNINKNANKNIKEKNLYINVRKCKLCGKYKSLQITCDFCKSNFCNNCCEIHLKEFPTHNKAKKNRKTLEYNNNKNKNFITKNYKCVLCRNGMNFKNNETIIFCDKCKGNICGNCKKTHILRFPKHNQIISKIIFFDDNKSKEFNCSICSKDLLDNLNEPICSCNKCKGILCKDCRRSHSNEFIRHILEYKFFIPNYNNEEMIKENSNTNKIINKRECLICHNNIEFKDNMNNIYCYECNGLICENCIKIHFKNNDNHKTIQINKKLVRKNNELSQGIQNTNCILCKNDINDSIIFNCFECKGDLCDDCGKEHYINKSKHNITMIKYLLKEKIYQSNCAQCGKNLKNIINYKNCENCRIQFCIKCGDYHKQKYKYHNITIVKNNNSIISDKVKNKSFINEIYCSQCAQNLSNVRMKYCLKCNINLCDDCSRAHNKKYPKHVVSITKYNSKSKNSNNDENISSFENCHSCQKNLFSIEDSIINHCFDCKVNFCVKCSKNHIKNNINHDLNLVEVKLLNKDEKYEENSICDNCGDNLKKDKTFYQCENCDIDLCHKCLYIHYKSKPNHNFIFAKYEINEKEFVNNKDNNDNIKCDICEIVTNINNNSFCENCQYIICKECVNLHKRKYPEHYLILNKLEKNNEVKTNGKYFENISINKIKRNDFCNICRIKLNNNSSKNTCNYCNNYFCNECINLHYEQNSDHRLIKSSSQKNILTKNLLFSSDEQNEKNSDEKCNKCLQSCDNSSIYKCNQCKIKLCQECTTIHNKMFSSHKLSLFKNNIIKKEDIPEQNNKIKCSCLLCNKSHFNFPNLFFYVCSECNSNICSLCKKIHDNKYYSHILDYPHKYGEEIDMRKRHRRYSSVG